MLKRLLIIALMVLAPPAFASSKLGDDGLHHEDWFATSLLDLRDDAAEAAAAGKHLVVVWEQKGCIYCEQLHDQHLNDPKIVAFMKANFLVVQLDYRGDRLVTDLDGQELPEKEMARKNRAATTPTVHFVPMDLGARKGKPLAEAEVARMPGLLKPDAFYAMLEYVQGKHYANGQSFQKWLAARGS